MATDLHFRKMAHRFGFLDTDGDGYIEHSDYELLTKRLSERLGHGEDSPSLKAFRDAYLSLWQGLLRTMDSDGDGRISKDEFVAATVRGIIDRPGGYDRVIGPVAVAFLEMGDGDGDGRLNTRDFENMYEGLGVDHAHTVAAFKAIDTDADGYVSTAEVARAIEDFYLSTDTDVAGNILMGPHSG